MRTPSRTPAAGGRQGLQPADLLTLSRVLAAAPLAGAAAAPRRPLGPAVWLGLILGCTLSDWLDGPLARRAGATRLGARLDAEADAWLTLSAALAAGRRGAVPALALVPPLARYALCDLRATAGARWPAEAGWQRAAGAAQMAVLVAALAPRPGPRGAAQALARPAAGFQMLALTRTAWRMGGCGEKAGPAPG